MTTDERAVFDETYAATRQGDRRRREGSRRPRGGRPQPARARRPHEHQPGSRGTPRGRRRGSSHTITSKLGNSPRPDQVAR